MNATDKAGTAFDGITLDAARGATLLVSFAFPDLHVCGQGQVLVAHPPRPGPGS
jgi:hypothetical protein